MSHQRQGERFIIIQRWSQNVSLMLAEEDAEVWFHCSYCRRHETVDLRRLVKRNIAMCLWNRKPKCSNCGKRGFFMGHHAPNSPVNPLVCDEDHADVRHRRDLERVYKELDDGWRGPTRLREIK